MAAMWEVVVLHALSGLGSIRNEVPLSSGRRPDIAFASPELSFVADITSVSDDGLDSRNPFSTLMQEIEATKTRLGLAVGGLHLDVQSVREQRRRGTVTTLRLPERARIPDFVREEILPQLRQQIAADEPILRISLEDENVGLSITINPRKSPYNSGHYAAYDIPTIRDKNPLYSAMKGKADQLRAADSLKGIIVGDAACRALADRGPGGDGLSARPIAAELLRQYSSIDFVLLLSVREAQHNWMRPGRPERGNWALLEMREGHAQAAVFDALFRQMMAALPPPVMMPSNGALRAQEPGYDLGHHGGYQLGGRKVRIGARELIEVLAGQRSLADDGAKFPGRGSAPVRPNMVQAAFARNLAEGRLPASITVIPTDENDSDDWIEFEFGDVDPAIAPLK